MGTTTKTFDCVEMKSRIQRKILDEYEAEKDRFPSFVAFIKDRNDRSEASRLLRDRMQGRITE
jgi:hypothetical protein